MVQHKLFNGAEEWEKVKLLCHTLALPLKRCYFLRKDIPSYFSLRTKEGNNKYIHCVAAVKF